MKRTWKENFTAAMRQQIKKHKRLKLPITVFMILLIVFYNIGHYFTYNTCSDCLYILLYQQQFLFSDRGGEHGGNV